jgi:Protein of unknown function (DUF3095)
MDSNAAHLDHQTPGFFGQLPVLSKTHDTFDTAQYFPAPGDWALVVTDIVDSTNAVAQGRHKTVNFVAAMAIAAMKNLCAPTLLPFLFGGDGSVVMVPPQWASEARRVLARVRGLAEREFGLRLRVGLAPVSELRRFGSDVHVGRFEPSPGNSFGVFLGGGVGLLEAAVRGRGNPELITLAHVPEALDDGAAIDLSGLSCRWNSLRSRRGKMVTLIIRAAADPGEVHAAVMRLAGQAGDPQPARPDNLGASWPPKGFMLEARARRRGGSLALSVLGVLAETLLARLVFAIGRPIGGFDPQQYRAEVATNTDFCKHDDTVSFVIDCATSCIAPIKGYLDLCSAKGELRYGMGLSETALMTCLVTSVTEGLHVHFVDGGDGGYTYAARMMKSIGSATSPPGAG